ncbi:glutaredoxin domain-containing protein [Leptotrichia sp. oral taxon 223]|uniref:glutaredoxin domain-containing protein n=1 Tax=Leptotrichia sp. oral taxon 223 TaxID=712363 RepID=UPI0015BC6CAF|nr:glutaredoxin domain-containing protein [Leptotrichia sp. oral taxon 223]NWO19383.1 glutaredoxin [Leptotrichia sp. oral taxon 223]
MFWRKDFKARLDKSRVFALIILIFSMFLVNQINYSAGNSQGKKVKIEYFGRKDCKNCANLEKFLKELSTKRDDFEYVEHKIDENEENKAFFDETTSKLKLVKGTPIIYIDGHIIQGFNTADTTGKEIESLINSAKAKDKILTLKEYVESGQNGNVSSNGAVCTGDTVCEVPGLTKGVKNQVLVNIPIINKTIDLTNYSLFTMSIILGTIDGFNPCAMWVLVLFLTALIAVGNKVKMFRVAGLFILAEAVMYFLILNAWIYTWDFVGLDKWVTPIVGIVGIAGGIFFIKNYLKKGDTLECEVTDLEQRAKISRKVKDIANKPFTLLTALGIIGLALSVNVIEFACSIGIPQTYTKILQINEVPFWIRQFYTFIYIIGYMVDDIIVFGFALMSINKLQLTTKYSKWVNLFGGILMIILGLIMLIKPSLLIM